MVLGAQKTPGHGTCRTVAAHIKAVEDGFQLGSIDARVAAHRDEFFEVDAARSIHVDVIKELPLSFVLHAVPWLRGRLRSLACDSALLKYRVVDGLLIAPCCRLEQLKSVLQLCS